MLNIGDIITAPTTSTSGREYKATMIGITADVDLKGNTGKSSRSPCALGVDRHGNERLIVLATWSGGRRWLVSSHRTITMIREVENRLGDLVDGPIKARVDAALIAAEQ